MEIKLDVEKLRKELEDYGFSNLEIAHIQLAIGKSQEND